MRINDMKATVHQNEDGKGFLVIDDYDEDISEFIEMLETGQAVWCVSNEQLFILTIPDNIILGYN